MARLQQDGAPIILSDLADPVDDQDAATKAYVDANGGGGGDSITDIVGDGHINVGITDGVATLAFNEIFDIWNKDDWVKVNTGTPIFADDEFLWDSATNTLTVPDLGTHTVEAIQLAARTGMALHIRQENTTPDPSTFSRSGYYQILSITVTSKS